MNYIKKLTTELSYTADDYNTLHDDRMDDLFSVLGLHTEKEVDAEDGDIIDATLTNSAEIIPVHEDVDLAESEPDVASTTSLVSGMYAASGRNPASTLALCSS